ncbi:MAG: asparagine synthase C-terminal domain-containing protein [Pseudomonadota bacterium]
MSGICGWHGSAMDAATARQTADGMIRGLGATRESSLRSAYDHTSGLAAGDPFDRVSLHEESGLKASVRGAARWDDPELDRIAQRESPAVAAARAFRREGIAFLAGVHGPFSLAVIDGGAGTALVAVDRAGIHTMCHARCGGQFVFGSTADSVVAHPTVGRELDPQGIFNYLFFHVVPSPGSIYRDVRKLLPGQYALFRNGEVETGFYWRLDYADRSREPFARRAERLRELLRSSVRRAAGEEPAGAFLSGGTDSSTVAGVLSEVRGKPAATFSIGFAADGYDEMEFARITARHFGLDAHEYYVTPDDVVAAIPLVAAAYDEPFGNASAVPAYYCARMARENGVQLMLAGDGGDEIFGGNARYAKQKVFEYYQRLPATLRRRLVEPLALGLPQGIPPLRKLRSYVNQARVPLPDRLESYNFLHRTPLGEIFAEDYLAQIRPDRPEALMREVYGRTASDSYLNRMLHLDLKFTLADNDLRKVNRMCELAGVAVRYPLLDEEMLEFAAQLPPAYKVKGFKLRHFFKEALKDFLPPETITKTKQGFGLPFGVWMRNHAPLQQLAGDSLESLKGRRIVKPEYIDGLVAQHRSDHASYYGVMIWVLMMLEQWLQAHKP